LAEQVVVLHDFDSNELTECHQYRIVIKVAGGAHDEHLLHGPTVGDESPGGKTVGGGSWSFVGESESLILKYYNDQRKNKLGRFVDIGHVEPRPANDLPPVSSCVFVERGLRESNL
jgi:hypothetical protein